VFLARLPHLKRKAQSIKKRNCRGEEEVGEWRPIADLYASRPLQEIEKSLLCEVGLGWVGWVAIVRRRDNSIHLNSQTK